MLPVTIESKTMPKTRPPCRGALRFTTEKRFTWKEMCYEFALFHHIFTTNVLMFWQCSIFVVHPVFGHISECIVFVQFGSIFLLASISIGNLFEFVYFCSKNRYRKSEKIVTIFTYILWNGPRWTGFFQHNSTAIPQLRWIQIHPKVEQKIKVLFRSGSI